MKAFNKCLNSVIAGAMICAIPFVANANADESNSLIDVGVYTETIDTYDRVAFEKEFSQEAIDFLETSLGADIIFDDEEVTVKIRTKMQPAGEKGLTLYADGKPVEVSERGTITIPAETQTISKMSNDEAETFNADSFETIIPDSFYEASLENTRSNPEIIFKASCGDLIARMDENEEKCLSETSSYAAHKGYGDKYVPGDWVHCNRFNGQLTDDVHYNWRSGSAAEVAAAGRNFYASDCHIALVQAGSGCTSKGSCQCNTSKRAAYCSGFTKDADSGRNCSYSYHKHKGLVIPRK